MRHWMLFLHLRCHGESIKVKLIVHMRYCLSVSLISQMQTLGLVHMGPFLCDTAGHPLLSLMHVFTMQRDFMNDILLKGGTHGPTACQDKVTVSALDTPVMK